MRREGLTVTMVFLAESANYGEGIGNISTLKKMSRGNHEQYSYISRQAMRYNIVRQANWDQTPVDGKSGSVCTVCNDCGISGNRSVRLYEDSGKGWRSERRSVYKKRCSETE